MQDQSEKAVLKLNIQKNNIMASSRITSCQIEGEKAEAVTDFIFLGSIITVDSDCSHEIKRHLLLGRKAVIASTFSLYICHEVMGPDAMMLIFFFFNNEF